MTREEIIQGLQFTIDMFLSDPLTGEPITKPRNDMDKTTIDACKGAIKLLEQQPIIDVNVPHKIAEFFSNWDGDEDAKMEISVNDMREIAFVYGKKARIERQLKEKALNYNPDEWCHDCSEYDQDKHCCPRYNKVIRNTVEEMKQPKVGHWISYWDEEARCHVYKCPECGNKQPFDTKCCWECGTKLVEPQESEES